MIRLIYLIGIIVVTSCAESKKMKTRSQNWEIIKVDSVRDHFVFNLFMYPDRYKIVIGEMANLNRCRPFGKFIILDSISTTSFIKAANGKPDMVGMWEMHINGIKVKEAGELFNVISSCASFSNH
jgi:hypothetical protein